MFRVGRRPYPAAVGMVSILTAVLVVTGCTTDKTSDSMQKNASDAVLFLGDDPVSEKEYAMLAEQYMSRVSMQYSTGQANSTDFWQTEIDGTAPWELLDDLVQTELKHNYALKDLAVELNLTEDYTYQTLLESRAQENENRSETVNTDDGIVYGLKDFDEHNYYEYWYSNLETRVVKALVSDRIDLTEEECKKYYEDNPDIFVCDTSVTVLYAEISDAADTGESPDQTAMQMEHAMETTDSISELSDVFPQAEIQELTLSSLDTQAGMSGMYENRWQLASGLKKGQIYGPYEDNGALCLLKCTDRTENAAITYEEVKDRIESYLQTREAQEIISSTEEELEVSSGGISPEEVIAGID